jgi:hypothetical protein
MKCCKSIVATVATSTLLILVVHVTVVFAGKCCEAVSPAAECSGCVPYGAGYVNLGSNQTLKCKDIEQPLSCDEVNMTCATLVDAPLYESGCANIVDTISTTIKVPQCDNGASSCSAG